MESSLLCDEQLILCTPPSSPGDHSWRSTASPYSLSHSDAASCCEADLREADGHLRDCIGKQHTFVPRGGYVSALRRCPELSGYRHRALLWIMAARERLNLSFGTAFSAANYLDRFVSLYTDTKWETWMMELLSVACLSIAAKFDEVKVPSLHDLPVEDLDHSFDLAAIQRMELAVLRALDWRVNCITAHSFVGPLTSLLKAAHISVGHHRVISDRVNELLVGAACDVELVEYKPSVVAVSAVRCAVEELAPVESYSDVGVVLVDLLGDTREDMEELEECHKRMEERVADSVYYNTSSLAQAAAASTAEINRRLANAPPRPVTVVTVPGIHGAVDWIVDVGRNITVKMSVYVVCEEHAGVL